MAPIDPHSYTNSTHPLTTHISLTFYFDFPTSTILSSAVHSLSSSTPATTLTPPSWTLPPAPLTFSLSLSPQSYPIKANPKSYYSFPRLPPAQRSSGSPLPRRSTRLCRSCTPSASQFTPGPFSRARTPPPHVFDTMPSSMSPTSCLLSWPPGTLTGGPRSQARQGLPAMTPCGAPRGGWSRSS